MDRRLSHAHCWSLSILLIAWTAAGAEESPRLALSEVPGARPFLRYERTPYRNFAFVPFTNYPEHSWSVRTMGSLLGGNFAIGVDRAQALWSPLGDYLTSGFDLFNWIERRQPEQSHGSELFKDWSGWHQVFTNMAVASDGYGSWGYRAIVGDGLIARLSPLTLSKTDLNGLRLDLSTPHLKLTAVGSRISRPNRESSMPSENAGQVEAGHSTLLAGARAQADLGALRLGLNGVNLHSYHSNERNNSIKGMLRLDQPLYEWILVRIADDAPADGRGGAVVQEVQLILNGRPRPDLQPQVVRNRAGVPSQVGRTLSSGEFLPVYYNGIGGPGNYYHGREIPLFADYFYLLAHASGADVGKETHLPGLLANYELEDPQATLRADGEEQLVYLFDLGGEPYVESLAVEAVVGNDYRVDWAGLYLNEGSETAAKYEQRLSSTFYRSALRARGRVEDGSNLQRLRFEVGENTAIFTYSADAHLVLRWLEVNAEYARSALSGRYPARLEQRPLLNGSPRFGRRGSAYFVNALHRFGPGRLGAEYFSMHPDFTTEMETYLHKDYGYRASRGASPFLGLFNHTVIWRLVQDNEDGDRYPDFSLGNILGSPGGTGDGDGTFPGEDEDRDGIVDTDRNTNGVPDYEELFLMYEVEPNEYVYGLDRNHNDEPDHREDDWEADHPYDPDQRGFHLFAQADLSRHGSVGVGRYAVEGIDSGGRNRSLYALLSYRREGIARLRRLYFENNFRRVQDDIADEFKSRRSSRHPDLLFYQDSFVNETYLEGQLHPWSTLNLVQKLRLRLNWQQGGRLPNDRFQRQRRLDLWSVVSRMDYTWRWGKLKVTPQFKFLFLRQKDHAAGRVLHSEYRIIPILKLRYPLMSRTVLQAGTQGWGPVPYRVKNRTLRRENFEQRSTFVTLANRSRYFGYDLHAIFGINRNEVEFDNPFQRYKNYDGWTFFVRGLVGFTEYGRLI